MTVKSRRPKYASSPPERRGVGLDVPGLSRSFRIMSVLDNVRFGLTALPRAEAEADATALWALEPRRPVATMPKSFRTCCQAASNSAWRLPARLAPRPSVLLMDEPFSGLDSAPEATSIRADTARHPASVTGASARSSSRMMPKEAMRMGDRIALLKARLPRTGRYGRRSSIDAPSQGHVCCPPSSLRSDGVLEGMVSDGGVVDTPLGRNVDGKRFAGVVRRIACRRAPASGLIVFAS